MGYIICIGNNQSKKSGDKFDQFCVNKSVRNHRLVLKFIVCCKERERVKYIVQKNNSTKYNCVNRKQSFGSSFTIKL